MNQGKIKEGANSAEKLSHSKTEKNINIVTVLKHGDLPNSNYYFIDMELCDVALNDYISQHWPSPGDERAPFSLTKEHIQRVWLIMENITNGVEYIHSMKYIHRDIKPPNGIYSP
jgi:serine/threonine protein kinase